MLLIISPPYKHTHPLPHNQVLFENTDQDILIAIIATLQFINFWKVR